MLSFDTIHLLTDCLLDAERDTEQAGWHTPPALLCLHRDRTTGTDGADATTPEVGTIHSTPVPLPGPVHLDSYHPSLTAVLATMITAHHAAATAWAHAHHTSSDTRVLAWALLYIDNTDGSGPVRVVTAVDVDGRRYHLTRRHGETHPIADVTQDSGAQPAPTSRALAALVAATTAPVSDAITELACPPVPLTPAAVDTGQPDDPPASADGPVPGHDAELARLLLDCWNRFDPARQSPEKYHAETIAAVTRHIQAVIADHARQAADARRCATHNRTDLDRTRALFRAQIIGVIAEGNLDHELGAGILDACGLQRPRRHYTVWITVPFQVQVTAVNDQDAADAAIDHLELTLRPDERIDPDWAAHETGRVKPGEFELDQN